MENACGVTANGPVTLKRDNLGIRPESAQALFRDSTLITIVPPTLIEFA